MKRLSLLGIDGSGKTTLMRTLQSASPLQVSFLFSPDFHAILGFPGGHESLALTELSRLADAHKDLGLKLATLYLRMCLFGEAEQYLTATERPRTLCIERHPLVDALTYLPVYAAALKKSGRRLEESSAVMAAIAAERPDLARHFAEALARRNRRMPGALENVAQVAGYCLEFAALPAAQFVRSVARDFQTELPQTVLYLDITPRAARARLEQRGKELEAHESLEALTRLDQLARSRLKELSELGVTCVLVPVESQSEQSVLDAVRAHFEGGPA